MMLFPKFRRLLSVASIGHHVHVRFMFNDCDQTVADNGVTWKITASGAQSPQLDSVRIRGALAGRTPAEVRELLSAEGLRLTDLRISPEWWPRMPLLDARIAVN